MVTHQERYHEITMALTQFPSEEFPTCPKSVHQGTVDVTSKIDKQSVYHNHSALANHS